MGLYVKELYVNIPATMKHNAYSETTHLITHCVAISTVLLKLLSIISDICPVDIPSAKDRKHVEHLLITFILSIIDIVIVCIIVTSFD